MKNLSLLQWACLAVALLALLCLAPMPYGYYTVVRWAIIGLCGWLGYTFYEEQKNGLVVLCGLIAIIFQPIIRIHFERTTWSILDALIAIALVAYVVYTAKKK